MNHTQPTPAGPTRWLRHHRIRAVPSIAVAVWASSSVFLSLTEAPEILDAIEKLGYPSYTPQLIGFAKLAGLVAFIAPVPARLREWAYAGFLFELAAAVFSYVAAGYPADALAPATIAMIVALSWKLRQQRELTPAISSGDEADAIRVPA